MRRQAKTIDAFEVDACGYLLKPLDPGRFERTMNRVVKRLEERSAQTIVVQRGAACQVIALSEIEAQRVQAQAEIVHHTSRSFMWRKRAWTSSRSRSRDTGITRAVRREPPGAGKPVPRILACRRAGALHFPALLRPRQLAGGGHLPPVDCSAAWA